MRVPCPRIQGTEGAKAETSLGMGFAAARRQARRWAPPPGVHMGRLLYEALKRIADFVVASAVLLVSVPFWIWAFAAVTLTDGFPFLYPQTRVGRGRRRFKIYKFRSMVRDAEKGTGSVFSEKDDPRVTRPGRIMRKTAVDEIPQVLSIIRGDMSWIGPRAARPDEVARYLREVPDYDLRHQVRPGLTGLAQVYGSDYDNIPEKLAYDLQYIRERGLWLDLELFVRSWVNTACARWDKSRGKRRPSR